MWQIAKDPKPISEINKDSSRNEENTSNYMIKAIQESEDIAKGSPKHKYS